LERVLRIKLTPTAFDPPDDELDAELFPDVPQAARTSDPAPSTAIAAVALLSHRLHGLASICMTAPWRSPWPVLDNDVRDGEMGPI